MKANYAKPTDTLVKKINPLEVPAPKLSDDAFYILVLASLLKKLIAPVTLRQFLAPGNAVPS
ncbi:MAG: hypothetical protein WBC06_17380 [Chitinophagaceae bacterium]